MSLVEPGPIVFSYEFALASGRRRRFEVKLDPSSLKQVAASPAQAPADWTRLEVSRCASCPLNSERTPHCPVAVSIAEVVDFFAQSYAHEEARVTVRARERSYEKVCSLQVGIGSLIGLLMPTSGCPVLEPLRPLARTHLPFATAYETLPRVVSRYLFQQYLRSSQGKQPDWEMTRLSQVYAGIRQVNEGIAGRLGFVKVCDASRNAVSRLHAFSELLTFSIDENLIKEILDDFRDQESALHDAG